MFCAAVSFAQTAKLAGGDFYGAESILEVYRMAKGEDCKIASDCYDALYHTYNLMQFLAVLPNGSKELLEAVDDLKDARKSQDWVAAGDALDRLDTIVGGGRWPREPW